MKKEKRLKIDLPKISSNDFFSKNEATVSLLLEGQGARVGALGSGRRDRLLRTACGRAKGSLLAFRWFHTASHGGRQQKSQCACF